MEGKEEGKEENVEEEEVEGRKREERDALGQGTFFS